MNPGSMNHGWITFFLRIIIFSSFFLFIKLAVKTSLFWAPPNLWLDEAMMILTAREKTHKKYARRDEFFRLKKSESGKPIYIMAPDNLIVYLWKAINGNYGDWKSDQKHSKRDVLIDWMIISFKILSIYH